MSNVNILLFALLCLAAVNAQNFKGPVTTLRMISGVSAWAGGNGWIARTDNSGLSWRQQATIANIQQIFALNNSTAWASSGIKAPYVLYSTTNGGATWTKSGTVPNDGFLHFNSPTAAYCGNAISSNGGVSWTYTNVPVNTSGNVYFVNSTNGWAVNSTDAIVNFLRTTNGGNTWNIVYSRATLSAAYFASIRATGTLDVWFELYGGVGMTQAAYSLFHTADGGATWIAVLNNGNAGGGPAPGFPNENTGNHNAGNSPGALYPVNSKTAFFGGMCEACDYPNTVGTTSDGGVSWTNIPGQFTGFGQQVIAATDASNVWLITNDYQNPSVLYVSNTQGYVWTPTYMFPNN